MSHTPHQPVHLAAAALAAPGNAASPADEAAARLDSPALREFKRSMIYDRVAPPHEIEADIGVIRAMHARAQYGCFVIVLGLLGSLLTVAVLAVVHPVVGIIAGVMALIGFGIVRATQAKMKLDREQQKRVELASGLLRGLRIADGMQVRVCIDIAPMFLARKCVDRRNEGGWDVSYHADPWLVVEGELQGGIGFRYGRTEHERFARQVEDRSKSRITRTRVHGHFDEAISLRFSPQRYPRPAMLGAAAQQAIVLSQGFVGKHFTIQPGAIDFEVTSNLRWDAGLPGTSLEGIDAISRAGLWLASAARILDPACDVLLPQGGRLPRLATLPILTASAVRSAVTNPKLGPGLLQLAGGLVVCLALLVFVLADDQFSRASLREVYARGYAREASAANDPGTLALKARQAREAREAASDRRALGVGYIVGGFLGLGLGVTGLVLGVRLRRKRAIAEADAARQRLAQRGMLLQPPLNQRV